MTNNLQQLDKNEEIFWKFFWGCEPISLFGCKTGCTLLLRRRAQHKLQRGIRFHPAAPGREYRE
jgi:hypothetical protein